MLTDYDIQRLSSAIVEKLTTDDRFINRIAKSVERKERKIVNARRAAEILGLTRKTVCEIAEYLGGVKGSGKSAHWMFEEQGLIERYLEYKNTKS